MQIFMFVGVSVIEILLFNRKKKKQKQKKQMKNMESLLKFQLHVLHLYYKIFLIFLQISLAFNMCSTLVLVEVKLSGNKSVFPWAKINYHSNPYIKSTTVLSNYVILFIILQVG